MNPGKPFMELSRLSLTICAIALLGTPLVAWRRLPGTETKFQGSQTRPKKSPARGLRKSKQSRGRRVKAQSLTTAQLARARLAGVSPADWYEPPTIEWNDADHSRREVTLYAKMARSTVGDQPVYLRSYCIEKSEAETCGQLDRLESSVGSTIKLRPGDELYLNMRNQLPEESQPPHCRTGDHPADMNDPKSFCLNNTNLHTHGLHISPFRAISGDGSFDENYWSDNVLLSIRPGNQEKYKFQILPAGNPVGSAQMNHYPGTFWYHAHNHGSTAVQLASGMAGALIIKGDIDDYPGIKDAAERVFLFQQLAFDANGKIERRAQMGLGDIVTAMEQNWEGNNRPVTGPPKVTTINGRVNPLITLRPGQVERWRFIDAGVFEFLDVRLQDVQFHQIAIDGITLSQVKQIDHVEMGPGYRTDVMVKAPENPPPQGATYYLYKGLTSLTFTSSRLAAAQILATVRVEGQPCSQEPMCHSTLPTGSLPAPLPDITRVDRSKSISLTSRGMMMGNAFNIDGTPYNPDVVRPNFQLRKGTSEEWAITNMSMNPHPLHIHVNAFQMLKKEGREWKPAEWRDTIIIQRMDTVRFRTRYDRFIGDFVTHCHILVHEDMGMMQRVSIRP